jgi:HSP20 family protein
MSIMKWENPAPKDLWEAFDGMRGEMDRALDLFRVPDAMGLLDRSAAPAVDLIETPEEYLIIADLPGVDKKDLELSVTGSILRIKGMKKAEEGSEKRKFFRRETWAGSFERTLDLPTAVNSDTVSAELADGVLRVRAPKREEAKTKLITVSVN